MTKLYTFKELRENYKDMYLVVQVKERDERGFASKYNVLGVRRAKRDIEALFKDIEKVHPDAYIHETFLDSEKCFKFKIIDNELTKIKAFSPGECARMFRNYYNTEKFSVLIN